jgi:hypothetical protein
MKNIDFEHFTPNAILDITAISKNIQKLFLNYAYIFTHWAQLLFYEFSELRVRLAAPIGLKLYVKKN